jgi:hypothetical protein
VQAEAPRSRVAVGRHEVAPVLRDEPDAGEDCGRGREVVADAVDDGPERQPREEADAEVPFVDARGADRF